MRSFLDLVIFRGHRPFRDLLRRARNDVRGVAAIEFAIIIPTLIMMVVCTADLGMGIYRNMQVQNAAQAGARYAMSHPFDATSISNIVSSATGLQGIAASPSPSQYCGCATSSGISSVSCGSICPAGAVYGMYVKVSAQGVYHTIVSYPLIANDFTLAAEATVRVQ